MCSGMEDLVRLLGFNWSTICVDMFAIALKGNILSWALIGVDMFLSVEG